jgi:dihydropteroate synthase
MGQGMSSALRHRVDVVVQAGIDPESVLLDPSLDQGMTGQQSVRLLGALPRLTTLGHPVLVATSYEGAFGGLVARAPDERREASVVACAIAATLGARVFRVHDVRSVRGAVDLACAVTGPSVG